MRNFFFVQCEMAIHKDHRSFLYSLQPGNDSSIDNYFIFSNLKILFDSYDGLSCEFKNSVALYELGI